jgi:MazG family protein
MGPRAGFRTIAPYTIEEAYEVASAIEDKDYAALKDELGDLMLQVVFHSQMADEKGLFSFPDVVQAICTKMIRRHPHVFARGPADTPDAVRAAWDDIKRQNAPTKADSPRACWTTCRPPCPPLMRAVKLQNRAAEVGFDWPSAMTVADKIAEETRELAEAAESTRPRQGGRGIRRSAVRHGQSWHGI